MRVTYAINARLAGGGIGNTAHNAVKAIHRRGWLHRLIVSSSKTHEFDGPSLRSLGIVGRGMKRTANYDASNTLNWLADAAFDRWAAMQIPECDIFHGWNNHALSSLTAAHKRGAKTIIERGGSHILQTDQLLKDEFARWGWRASGVLPAIIDRSLREFDTTDYIMVPSQFNVDSFLARGVARDRILLLPLGVDSTRFTPNANLAPRPFRALFVGQVSLRKGIQYLLEAWRKANLADAELIVAGEIKADAARVTEPYRDEKTIRWLGHVSDPVALYQSAHVFVFPSIEEGSALVTYEAMASGLPSIVTHNAGSLVRDGVDGWIVSIQDADGIAHRLCQLHASSAEQHRLGRAARMAIKDMTWDAYGARLMEIYEQITSH